MNYEIINQNNKKIIYMKDKIEKERDINDIISLCMEYDTIYVILDKDCLSEDFYNLRTGLAGTALQKLINYKVKVSSVINESMINERFSELMLELNKKDDFKFFNEYSKALDFMCNN